jgi:hypothetical protein
MHGLEGGGAVFVLVSRYTSCDRSNSGQHLCPVLVGFSESDLTHQRFRCLRSWNYVSVFYEMLYLGPAGV